MILYDTGTYSEIFKYKDGNKQLICKKIPNHNYFDDDDEDYNKFHHVVNEIEILKTSKHPNIIKYINHEYNEDYTYLILEYGGRSLYHLYNEDYFVDKFDLVDNIMYQIFSGINYLHNNGIAHLDLSIRNIVINTKNKIKIIDFGMSLYEDQKLEKNLCSLYFSAPEILLGFYENKYSSDIWAVGCIWLMLLFNKNYISGKDEKQQLLSIFKLFGSPTENTWPGVKNSNYWDEIFENHKKTDLFLHDLNLKDIIDHIFILNPNNRITANESIKHIYFKK